MKLKMKNLEWMMNKRRLPQGLRQRVRNYERQCWAAMRGVDECQLIKNLPEGLRRDIKYHLCLGLVRQVWLPNFDYIFLLLILLMVRAMRITFTWGKEKTWILMLQYFVQVPLFQHMDELVLENICDRVKSLVFTKGETVSSKLH
jgi:hypothetical protein